MEKLTIDIREMFKNGLKEEDFKQLLESYEDKGYEVNQVYCTDEQREKVRSFTEKSVDKKTKKVTEVKRYDNVTLTVE